MALARTGLDRLREPRAFACLVAPSSEADSRRANLAVLLLCHFLLAWHCMAASHQLPDRNDAIGCMPRLDGDTLRPGRGQAARVAIERHEREQPDDSPGFDRKTRGHAAAAWLGVVGCRSTKGLIFGCVALKRHVVTAAHRIIEIEGVLGVSLGYGMTGIFSVIHGSFSTTDKPNHASPE